MKIISLLLTAITLLLPINAAVGSDYSFPITKPKALEIAKALFKESGRKVDDYRITVAKHGSEEAWLVWFDLKGEHRLPGGRHFVRVEIATGKTLLGIGE